MNDDDEELYLCKSINYDLKWFRKQDVNVELLEKFHNSKKDVDGASRCNTDKTSCFACNMKCRTRGIQLALNNCGVIVGYRVLYGSESTTQVALMYLDVCDNYQSNIFKFETSFLGRINYFQIRCHTRISSL